MVKKIAAGGIRAGRSAYLAGDIEDALSPSAPSPYLSSEALGEMLAAKAGGGGPVNDGGPATIIPSPGTPGIAPNVTATITGMPMIAAGTVLFSEGMPTTNYGEFYPFFGTVLIRSTASVINYGLIWHRVTGAFGGAPNLAVVAGAFGNYGTIVAEIDNGLIYGVFSYGTVGNEVGGRIFALAAQGSAFGVLSQDPFFSVVRNQGLIAAQGLGEGSAAYGVWMTNGGSFINSATGSILVEADRAIGLMFGRGTFPPEPDTVNILNQGLIRVHSLDSSYPSIGVQIEHAAVETMRMVNSGTIAADLAIYANSFAFSPPQKATEVIVNEASGQIFGTIFLDLGDDVLTNSGLIRGAVLLDEGADRFDNSAGILEGYADMGLGDDVFLGGAGTEAVTGGRGNDRMEGGGGQDLLVAGWGDDLLIGGAGNDGLFGEYGDDRFVTQGGDFVWGGSGDDRVELGDYSFELVDGDSGFDRLVLPAGPRILDLGLVLASGALHGFEAIELGGGKELVIRGADIAALTDGTELRIDASATDRIDLIGTWSEGAAQSIGGLSYRIFTSAIPGAGTVLISGSATVMAGGEVPAGVTGLDPIASGPLAPLPGEIAGVELTPQTTIIDAFFLHESLTIAADETWESVNGQAVLSVGLDRNIEIVNHGVIRSTTHTDEPDPIYAIVYLENYMRLLHLTSVSGGGRGAEALGIDYVGTIRNYGTISATTVGTGTAAGINTIGSGRVINEGLIEAHAQNGLAFGIGSAEGGLNFSEPGVHNMGHILATSNEFAVGIFIRNYSIIVNEGVIEVVAGHMAIGMHLMGPQIINEGEIRASVTDPDGTSYGLYLYANSNFSLDNRGLLQADVAIYTRDDPNYAQLTLYNSGRIEGRLELNLAWDWIANSGTMEGRILMGHGNDRYDGTGGTQIGGVYGENGNDTLIGGAAFDLLNGGDGNDILQAGGGNDRLDGGSGADIFTFVLPGDSHSYAMRSDGAKYMPDAIADFTPGTDKIDLSGIDAIAGTGANDAFTFLGTGAFTHQAGQLRYENVSGTTSIYADVDGDGLADLHIVALTPVTLTASDFVL